MFSSSKYLTVVGSRLKGSSFTSHLRIELTTFRSFHLLLEKCSSMAELKSIHSQIILHGFTNENLTIGKLISFCATTCYGDLRYGQYVFDHVRDPNKFMYNSLIRGYVNREDPIKAISLYHTMVNSGISPNEFTLPFVLKACACKSDYWAGVTVQGNAIKLGISCHVYVQNALMNVYIVLGLVKCAQKLFDEILHRNIVSWNSMIDGYSRMNFSKEAIMTFRDMRKSGMFPDEFTLANLISVSSEKKDFDLGRCIHCCVMIFGVNNDIIVQNSLINMYSKCGKLLLAQAIFNQMHEKNVISWTSMVNAFANHGLIELALKTFDQMDKKNVITWNSMISFLVREGRCKEALDLFFILCDSKVVPNEATLVSILSACSQLGDLIFGRKIHDYIRVNNKLSSTITLKNALMDMYAKCGLLDRAMEIFVNMSEKNVITWNVIIGALALHGCGVEAVDLFEKMQMNHVCPDEITFTGLLSACSHCGLVEAGQYYFEQMGSFYNVPPEIEHYACMIDLFGRWGLMEEAIKLIQEMPMKADIVSLGALLGACRTTTHGSIEIVRQILKQLLEMGSLNSGLYVLISNIFCEAKRWDDAKNIRKLMNYYGIKKCKGVSFIEIDGHVYEFLVEDERHNQAAEIYSMIDQLTEHIKPL